MLLARLVKLRLVVKSYSYFPILVGITWDDAPTEQHAVINTDYKIRCVVLASPPATIDWLKESLIMSTGKKIRFFNKIPSSVNAEVVFLW